MPRNSFLPGNPGKQKGTLNKTTRAAKDEVLKAIGFFGKTLEADIAAMTATERVYCWMHMQEFLLPKLQRTQVDVGSPEDTITQITFRVIKSDGTTIERIGSVRKELPSHNEDNSESGIQQIGENIFNIATTDTSESDGSDG